MPRTAGTLAEKVVKYWLSAPLAEIQSLELQLRTIYNYRRELIERSREARAVSVRPAQAAIRPAPKKRHRRTKAQMLAAKTAASKGDFGNKEVVTGEATAPATI